MPISDPRTEFLRDICGYSEEEIVVIKAKQDQTAVEALTLAETADREHDAPNNLRRGQTPGRGENGEDQPVRHNGQATKIEGYW